MTMETGEASEQEEAKEEDTEDEAEPEQIESEGNREPEKQEKKKEKQSQKESSGEKVLALPKVRKLAEEKKVDLASINTGERITEEEVLEAAGSGSTTKEEPEKESETEKKDEPGQETESNTGGSQDNQKVKATPAVRKLAREKEVNIQSVEGSGRGGKVTRDDVLQASKGDSDQKEEKETEEPQKEKTEKSSVGERRKLSGIEQKISERMEESRFTAPHVTHIDKADVTELVELREEKKDKVDVHLTYLPFIMKAAMLALKQYPELNAELDEESDELILHDSYNFNIAVDTENGLMIPLVEDVDGKNIVELAEEVGDKAGEARHGELSASDMENGTFSITNIGVIGGESFTPIINYPQAAILGIGKIQETAEVVDGEVVPRHKLKLSLSYDHRIIDGATAARFTNTVIENLEDPEQMLLEL